MAGKRVAINILPTATGGLPPANLTIHHDPQIFLSLDTKKWWISHCWLQGAPGESRSTPEANHGVLDNHEEQDLVEVVPGLVSQAPGASQDWKVSYVEWTRWEEIPSTSGPGLLGFHPFHTIISSMCPSQMGLQSSLESLYEPIWCNHFVIGRI